MNKKGFTLIELIIAMAISSIMLTGLYAMFSSVINAKESLESATDELYQLQALQRIIARDIRLMGSSMPPFPPLDSNREYMMIMHTQDSLTFNKAFPVNVAYIYDYDNKTVYRTERMLSMNYEMYMPMLPNITEWYVESFDGNEYEEGFRNNAFLFRFTFTINNRRLQFITGRIMNVTS